jgi:hypothetical protein
MSVPPYSAFVAALFMSLLTGFFLVSMLWPARIWKGWVWVFAPGVGFGVSSLIFFVFRRPVVTVDLLVLVGLALLWYARRKPMLSAPSPLASIALIGVVFLGGAGAAGMVSRMTHMPHGGWDGFAIWNSNARYMYRDGPSWTEHIKDAHHPDYPPLVPASVARLWRYAGEELPETGGVLGIVLGVGVAAVLFAGLAELRGSKIAAVAVTVLLTTPFYLEEGAGQGADVPLSLFYLTVLALLCLQYERAPDSKGLLALAGIAAGFAGWTKNEGVLFIAIVCGVLLLPVLRAPGLTVRRFAPFLLGLLVPLSAIAFFKVTIAPGSEFTSHRTSAEVIAKITDPSRYGMIADTLADNWMSFGGWVAWPIVFLIALVLLTGFAPKLHRNRAWLSGVAILVLLLSGYFAVYVITPMDLRWHLDSSLRRLLLQLWPSLLLLGGLACRSLHTNSDFGVRPVAISRAPEGD